MLRRITAVSVTGVLVFAMVTGAWRACGPKPGGAGGRSRAVIVPFDKNEAQESHGPCASLKNQLDLASFAGAHFQESLRSLKSPKAPMAQDGIVDGGVLSNNLSPPLNFLFRSVPIFQLNSNLRI